MITTSAPALPGLALAASPYLAGFDQDSAVTTWDAATYFNQGYRYCIRYLSLGDEAPSDLSNSEALLILHAGLALMPVQHVDASGWEPSASLGSAHGAAAASNAQTVGFPPGVCVWLDLEGVSQSASASEVIAYCQAWLDAVAAAGYVPGLYVGAQCGLDAGQLTALAFEHYWQSASAVPAPARGYQMIQYSNASRSWIDDDLSFVDESGGQALWLAPSTPVYPTLSRGADGGASYAAVMGLQTALNAAGASPELTVDGIFGAGTELAVQSFQTTAGLPDDGVAGAMTWSALVAAAASARATRIEALLPYSPVLPMTSQVHLVFGKVLGLIPSTPGENLASELATLLGAPPDAGGGAITPGDLSSVASVLASVLAGAPSGGPLHDRLSALQVFFAAQASAPSTLPRIAVVSAAMSQIGAVDAGARDPSNPALRAGSATLLEFFVTAFGDTTSFDPTQVTQWSSPYPGDLPDWCGLFALWANKTAGVWAGDWRLGSGISAVPGFMALPSGTSPLPGDVGYLTTHQHMFVVASISGTGTGTEIMAVSGNSGSSGIIQMEPFSLGSIAGFFRAAGLSGFRI